MRPLTEEERGQLDRVVELLRAELGGALHAASLFGSATHGGLRPRSDLDVLVVVGRRLTVEEKRALGYGLLRLTGRPRRLELTAVALEELDPWRYPPRQELQYGDWLRGAFERGEAEAEPVENPDLALLVEQARRTGLPLVGSPPGQLFEPVPAGDLARALARTVDDVLRDLDGDTRNVLLTLARVWCTSRTGELPPKDVAAAWALERLPPELRPPLERARAIYLGESDERWDDLTDALRDHVEHVVAEIRAG